MSARSTVGSSSANRPSSAVRAIVFQQLAGRAAEAIYGRVRATVGDTLTPVSAFCKIQEGEWAFLFESVVEVAVPAVESDLSDGVRANDESEAYR